MSTTVDRSSANPDVTSAGTRAQQDLDSKKGDISKSNKVDQADVYEAYKGYRASDSSGSKKHFESQEADELGISKHEVNGMINAYEHPDKGESKSERAKQHAYEAEESSELGQDD